jgi:hypothetical protein
MATLQEAAYTHYQSRYDQLHIAPIRLRDVPDEGALLSEHAEPQDHPQHL